MAQSERSGNVGSRNLGRRQLLHSGVGLLGVVLTATATGCSPSDPRVEGSGPGWSPSASPTPTPATPSATPSAVQTSALGAERGLQGLAAAILAGRHRADLSANQRALLIALVSAHRQHAAALADPDPTSRPLPPAASTTSPSPPAGFAKLSLVDSLSLLGRNERAQAARERVNARSAIGFMALLHGSISVAASSYAAALKVSGAVPTATAQKPHLPMTAMTDVAAIQSMVRQLHALVYGYQLALGQLSASSPAGSRALASLKDHRELRDRLTKVLLARGASVPTAAGAYVPSVNPSTAARSARLIRGMEVALQPFCGLWLASGTKPEDRVPALDTLLSTVATARSWNAPLTVWPGWQD